MAAAFTKLKGIIATGSSFATTEAGVPIKSGVIIRFAGIITSVIVTVPATSASAAPFYVFLNLYVMPAARQKLPVEIMCIIMP